MKTTNIISQISAIKHSANAFIMAELAAHNVYGLVPSHGDILMVLFYHQDVTMNKLAEAVHRSKPTVTVLVRKLEELELVYRERSSEDGRSMKVALTAHGKSFKKIFDHVSVRVNEQLLQGLSDEDITQLEALLSRVRTNMC